MQSQSGKGNETLDVYMGEDKEVTISVSHTDLAEFIRPRGKQSADGRSRLVSPKGVQTKVKYKALHDITNSLDPSPLCQNKTKWKCNWARVERQEKRVNVGFRPKRCLRTESVGLIFSPS